MRTTIEIRDDLYHRIVREHGKRRISVTINEIKKGNKRFCLSPNRALKKCHECKSYIPCESKIINHEYERLIKQKSQVHSKYMETIKKINEGINSL